MIDPVLLGKNHEANLPCESHQKRFCRDAKLYKCEECSRMFKHARSLSSHQRTHLNKKSELLCVTCQKMFKRVSDRRTHEIDQKTGCSCWFSSYTVQDPGIRVIRFDGNHLYQLSHLTGPWFL